jgi:hypothetical protein
MTNQSSVNYKKRFVFFMIIAFSIFNNLSVAFSQDRKSEEDWQFRMVPYAWVSALNGEVGLGPIVTDVNLSMSDILSNAEGALMLGLDARKGRWNIGTDLFWAQLSDSAATPRGEVFTNAEITVNQILWTQTVGYSVVKEKDQNIDFFTGFRLMYIDTELKLDGGLASSRKTTADEYWMDPIVGVRGQFDIANTDLFIRGMGDIGGFSVSSQLTWQALMALGYQYSESTVFGAGYRALGYDYRDNLFSYDAIQHGPVLGLEFYF